MNQAKRVAKNMGILYARLAITVFISLYVTRLVLAALGVEDFGIFNVVGGAIAMLTFLNASMASATQRFMSYAQGQGNHTKQKSIFNVSMLLHFVIAIVIVLLLEGAGYFLFNGILKIDAERIHAAKLIYQFLIVSTFFTVISVPYDAVINAHENMLFVAILGIVEAFLKLGVALYITYTNFDKLISYGFLMALIAVLLLLIRRMYCHRKYEEVELNISKYYDKLILIEMSGFTGWSFLGSSTGMLTNYGQTIVINVFFGTLINAAQGIAVQINGQLMAFANVLMKALNPLLVKSEASGNRDMMIKATYFGSKISFFILMFFYVPVILEMPYIYNIWLKEVPEYAIIFTSLQLIRSLIEQPYLLLTTGIGAVGKIKYFQIFDSIINVFPLIVSYILFSIGYPPYTLYFVFIVFAIVKGLNTIYFAKIKFNLQMLDFLKKVIFRCFISFIVIIMLTSIPLFFMNDGFNRLLVIMFINTILFSIVVMYFGLLKDERNHVKLLMFHYFRKIMKH